jgi:hypothetical protein
MSKTVKRIGRSVKKVVRGVSKAVSGIVKGVGKVVSKVAGSKLGRIILTAAAVYFGGAALMGGMAGVKAAGASTGFLGKIGSFVSGAGTGIGNAWTNLIQAGASAFGGDFSQAGSQLMAGSKGQAFTPPLDIATTANLSGVSGLDTLSQASQGMSTPLTDNALNSAYNFSPSSLAPTGPTTAPASSGLFSSDLAKYGLVSGGMQLAGGLVTGIGQQKALEDQRKFEQQRIDEQRQFADANQNFGIDFVNRDTDFINTREPFNQTTQSGMRAVPDQRFVRPGLINQNTLGQYSSLSGMTNPMLGMYQG